jgi:hypothetical protein
VKFFRQPLHQNDGILDCLAGGSAKCFSGGNSADIEVVVDQFDPSVLLALGAIAAPGLQSNSSTTPASNPLADSFAPAKLPLF